MSSTTTTGMKSPLDRDTLRDVVDLSLWAGQMLLHCGAESERVEETVHRLGTGLGCDWMDILVSPNVIIVTTTSGGEFRTKVRRVVGMRVDMNVVAQVNDISHQVMLGKINRFQVREILERVDAMQPLYNRWLIVFMVGLGCAAFSRLFGGDLATFAATFVASAVAMFVRQELTRLHLNHYLVIIMTSLTAALLAGLANVVGITDNASISLAAAVLLSVPGVSLINAAEDLIKGHTVTGITRALVGALISMCIALGLLLAIIITGVAGL